jgi:hypothetical protein
VSLFTLIPGVDAGWVAVAVSLVGLSFVVGSLISLLRGRREHPGELRDTGFLIGVSVMFVAQLWQGLELASDEGNTGALRGICVVVVACLLVGIARAWELIGGPSIRLRSEVVATFRDRDHEEGSPH